MSFVNHSRLAAAALIMQASMGCTYVPRGFSECGDGYVSPFEECDLGEGNGPGARCTLECRINTCGDGRIDPGEECDLGEKNSDDGFCTTLCEVPACAGSPTITPDPAELWTISGDINGSTHALVNGVATDGSGKIGATGEYFVRGEARNIWVAVYDSDGMVLWTRTFTSAGSKHEAGMELAFDNSGNLIVVGTMWEMDTVNLWLRKYDQLGNEVWTQTVPGVWGRGLAVDDGDNIVAAGMTDTPGGIAAENAWLRKYDSDGVELWTREYDGIDQEGDGARAVSINKSGDIVVAGHTSLVGTPMPDGRLAITGDDAKLWVMAYDSAGTALWTHVGETEGEWAFGATTDGADNVIVVGQTGISSMYVGDTVESDILVRKFDPTGVEQWTATYDSPSTYISWFRVPGSPDWGFGIAADSAGNVVAAGSIMVCGEHRNVWLGKYSPDGVELWTRTYDGIGNYCDEARDVTFDSSGNAIVAGMTCVSQSWEGIQMWIRKYKP